MEMSIDLADINIYTIDDRTVTLYELIKETTDEEIEHFTSMTGQVNGVPELQSFTAWTKSNILVLYTTTLGSHLECYERNP